HLNKLYATLEGIHREDPALKGGRSSKVADVLHEVAEKIHKRSLVILFSDMFDSGENTTELFKALQHLKHNKHEVVVFHVMDNETELEFEFEERPAEFIDLETGERLKLNPRDVKENYRKTVGTFHQALKLRCNQYKIDFVEADVQMDMNTILQTYLIKRAKMR
ncbi:MAG: DUF58 domain-containing protein, partial [Bacteroidia bacterium]|nr:DUF58 domain-containing protein [Bacteroidia bacterium]